MEKNKNKNFKDCEICDSNATCLCYKCYNYYCEQCYKFIHDKQKNSNHKKESVDPYLTFDLKCPAHPTYPMYLFCVDESGK